MSSVIEPLVIALFLQLVSIWSISEKVSFCILVVLKFVSKNPLLVVFVM